MGEGGGKAAALAWADAYQLNSATDRGAGGRAVGRCTVGRCTVGRGYTDAEGTASRKVRLLVISN